MRPDISLFAYDAWSPHWGKDTFLERWNEAMTGQCLHDWIRGSRKAYAYTHRVEYLTCRKCGCRGFRRLLDRHRRPINSPVVYIIPDTDS